MAGAITLEVKINQRTLITSVVRIFLLTWRASSEFVRAPKQTQLTLTWMVRFLSQEEEGSLEKSCKGPQRNSQSLLESCAFFGMTRKGP
jgi:hypothetical protein